MLGGGVAAVVVSTTMIVIFGEIIPQAVSLHLRETALLALALLLRLTLRCVSDTASASAAHAPRSCSA